MADFNKFFPTLMKFEGTVLENVPHDNGGYTKCGVTLQDYQKYGIDHNEDGKIDEKDLGLMTLDEASRIIKKEYWDKFLGDLIINQTLASFIVDYAFNCGVSNVAKKVQTILGCTPDGLFGKITIGKINSTDPTILFNKIKQNRMDYYNAIVANHPSQKVFLNGWLNRTNSFKI